MPCRRRQTFPALQGVEDCQRVVSSAQVHLDAGDAGSTSLRAMRHIRGRSCCCVAPRAGLPFVVAAVEDLPWVDGDQAERLAVMSLLWTWPPRPLLRLEVLFQA